jgi:hypothetical protein
MFICDSFDFVRPREKRQRGFVGLYLHCQGSMGGLESSQTKETENVTNQQVTVAGGSGTGSTAVGVGGNGNTANVNVTNYNADADIISTVTNSLTGLAELGQSESAQATAYSDQTTNTLAQDLAAITANASPQTAAASQEILAGTSPLGAEPGNGNSSWVSGLLNDPTLVDFTVIAGTLVSVWAFLRTRGK